MKSAENDSKRSLEILEFMTSRMDKDPLINLNSMKQKKKDMKGLNGKKMNDDVSDGVIVAQLKARARQIAAHGLSGKQRVVRPMMIRPKYNESKHVESMQSALPRPCGMNEKSNNKKMGRIGLIDKKLKLEDLDVTKMIYIITNKVIKDENCGLYRYRYLIVKYFLENSIDGKKFNENEDKFVGELRHYINANDNKLENLLREFVFDMRNLKL